MTLSTRRLATWLAFPALCALGLSTPVACSGSDGRGEAIDVRGSGDWLFASEEEIESRAIARFEDLADGLTYSRPEAESLLQGIAVVGKLDVDYPIRHPNGVIESPPGHLERVDAYADQLGESGLARDLRRFEGLVVNGYYDPEDAAHAQLKKMYLGRVGELPTAPGQSVQHLEEESCEPRKCEATCKLHWEPLPVPAPSGSLISNDCVRARTRADATEVSAKCANREQSHAPTPDPATAEVSYQCQRAGILKTVCDFAGEGCEPEHACDVVGRDRVFYDLHTEAQRDVRWQRHYPTAPHSGAPPLPPYETPVDTGSEAHAGISLETRLLVWGAPQPATPDVGKIRAGSGSKVGNRRSLATCADFKATSESYVDCYLEVTAGVSPSSPVKYVCKFGNKTRVVVDLGSLKLCNTDPVRATHTNIGDITHKQREAGYVTVSKSEDTVDIGQRSLHLASTPVRVRAKHSWWHDEVYGGEAKASGIAALLPGIDTVRVHNPKHKSELACNVGSPQQLVVACDTGNENPISDDSLPSECGGEGEACCITRRPQAPEHPEDRCEAGKRCNEATNFCKACGGHGQQCCDGGPADCSAEGDYCAVYRHRRQRPESGATGRCLEAHCPRIAFAPATGDATCNWRRDGMFACSTADPDQLLRCIAGNLSETGSWHPVDICEGGCRYERTPAGMCAGVCPGNKIGYTPAWITGECENGTACSDAGKEGECGCQVCGEDAGC